MGMKVNGTSGLTFPDTTTLASAGQASVRAWVNFNGTGTVAIRAAYNVASITDNGTGTYTLNFTTAMADANYSVVGACGDTANVTAAGSLYPLNYATGSVRVASYTNATGVVFDCGSVNVAVFR